MVTQDLQIVESGNIYHHDREYLIERYKNMVSDYRVTRLVTEKFTQESKRGSKAQGLVKVFRQQAKSHKIYCSSYSKAQVGLVFEPQGAYLKYQRAKAVCEVFKPLKAILPAPRKIYEGERLSMHIFDCAVLTLTHEYLRRS